MSEVLFGRGARLVVGKPGEDGIEVEDLRIRFKVEKSLESVPNKAEIAVYNLSASNRARAEAPGNIISLDAGYGGLLKNVFVGDVSRSLSRHDGTDWITEFESGDGEKAYTDSVVDISFGAGSTVGQVVDKLSAALGLPISAKVGLKDSVFKNGFVASGPVRTLLDQLTLNQELEWSIQDGALQILPVKTTTQGEAFILSPASGLLGSPRKKDAGLEVRSLLIPEIKPGRALVVESAAVKGVYKIRKVTAQGDTHGADWYTIAEVV